MIKFRLMLLPGLLLVWVLSSQSLLARERTDVITMLNGDRITGEIKLLEHGQMKVETDSLGTLSIEWDEVATVQSQYEFIFETAAGKRYVGSLETPGQRQLHIEPGPVRSGGFLHRDWMRSRNADTGDAASDAPGQIEQAVVNTNFDNVVRIAQQEDNFFEQLTGSISLGFNYTKSSDISQFNMAFNSAYRTPVRQFALSVSSISTQDSNDEEDTTKRSSVDFSYTRFLRDRWLWGANTSIETNEELGLNLRVAAGVAGGRYLLQTNRREMALAAGLQVTRENLVGEADTQENLEGVLSASYSEYLYDNPKVNIQTELKIFPVLSESGRWRAELDASIRRELITDLYLDLTVYDSYDSEPPGDTTETNDYGIVTSLGYSF